MRGVIDMIDTVITESVKPPLTVDYARRHIKSLTPNEDVLLASWIFAAAQYVEAQTGRQIITCTRELWMDAFPSVCTVASGSAGLRIELPRPPLQSVVSVQYVDGDGVVQSFTDGASPETLYYQTKAPTGTYARRGYIEPISGRSWPTARCEGGAVRIRYVAGYGDAPADVPELLRGVLCFLVAHFDQVRAAVHEARRGQMLELPYGVQTMLDEFKYSAYPTRVARAMPFGGMGY